ncbi:hypothetical protein CFC21_053940 [Triticum aestivum]|uniref:Late embryogenesis abundant protein LEA-2 subgroup domain-containing protein n=2 Tax=Triticum aestivum TaxID=4565 RepID=A0A9R1GCI0_WHEAT|nr:hypothetical protein CFC21_053940 [Triticum aestivum]
MAAGAGVLCKASRFRWLCLVRSVVATAVAVFAGVLVVWAVFLLFNPLKLQLRIPSSSVAVRRVSESGDLYRFTFFLQATNLRNRTSIYYHNVTIRLADSQEYLSLPPENRTFIATFNLKAKIFLSQGKEAEYILTERVGMKLNLSYLRKLLPNQTGHNSIDVAMEVDGFITDYGPGVAHRATYICIPLKLMGNSPLSSLFDESNAYCAPTY